MFLAGREAPAAFYGGGGLSPSPGPSCDDEAVHIVPGDAVGTVLRRLPGCFAAIRRRQVAYRHIQAVAPVPQGVAAPGAAAKVGDVLLQRPAAFLDDQGVGGAYIPEMPWLVGDAGDRFLAGGVPQDEAVPGRQPPEPPAKAAVREQGAEEVHLLPPLPQVDGKAGLVLAAPVKGHIFAGEVLPLLIPGVRPDETLLGQTAPAGHGDDGRPAPGGLDTGGL